MDTNSNADIMEGAIFKMKKTLTGFKWKKKWVRTDGVKVYQWATEVKPGNRTKPKHVYNLAECVVREITANKPNAFCVHENSKNDMMVFAAKDRRQLDQWLRLLTNDLQAETFTHHTTVTPEDDESEPEGDPEDENDEALNTESMSKRDLAMLYFEEYDISNEASKGKKTAIDEKLFPDLMNYIGIQLSNSDLFFSLQSVKNDKAGIYLKDFLLWLDQHPELVSSDHEGVGGDDDDINADYDDMTSRYSKLPKKALSFECDELLRLNHSSSSWLNIVEPSHLTGILDCNRIDLIDSSTIVTEMQHNMPKVSEIVKTWPFEGAPKDWNVSYQELLERVTDGDTQADKLELEDFADLYKLCAIQGHFVQTAVAGCSVIVDEYSLPTSLKVAKLISITDTDAEDDIVKETEEEIYFLNNLIFRLLGNSSSDKDQNPSETRMQYVVSSDEIVRKIAGNDFRSHEAVKKALTTMSNNACYKGGAPFNANVLLTTMIDYCGFRLQVFSPLEIDEPSTLLLGSATTENIYVNAVNDIDFSVIPALATAMNISLSTKEMLTCTETLNKRHPSAATKVRCQILSRDIQLHRCGDDERNYLFNFNNFLPPDFPRPDSNDLNTRHLRPEYVASYTGYGINNQAVNIDSIAGSVLYDKSRNNGMLGSTAVEGGVKQTHLGENSLQVWLRAASHLHAKVIPEVVILLDTMSALPLDSCGLTEFLHSHGVNMRHLGKIYKSSTVPHVKDLILCEAIARSVKSLLNQTLRNIARKGRAETIIAEDRKRSQKEDFVNHQSKILMSKTAAVIYFFNIVLGYGPETDKFWNNTLPKILLSKFDLRIPKQDKKLLLFFPQLIQALEYHTNVYFSVGRKYMLASPSNPEPFTEDDLVNYDYNSKFQLNIAGVFRRCDSIAEAFLASNMLPQAIVAFKIRLSTQSIFMRAMSKPSGKVKHQVHLTTYKLALCYFLDNKFDIACSLLASVTDKVRKICPFRGRIMTLFMCADFKNGHIERALQHYEAAQFNYLHSLGPRHPMIAHLYNTLADLYFGIKAYSHAKLFVYKALDFSQNTLGLKHIVNAGHYYKLGTIFLEESSFIEAIDVFHDALDRYSHYATNGAAFEHEISECYHGLAIAECHLGNVNKEIAYCKKSLAISTAGDKYITSHAVSCIILLAEAHERKLELRETINLYSDAWTIVQAYAKDFELPKILVIIAARIFSTYINSQPMHHRMMFHAVAADCESKNCMQKIVSNCSAFISQELVRFSPVYYITNVFKLLTTGAENVLSTHSKQLVGSQKSIIGVPCPKIQRGVGEGEDSEPDTEPPVSEATCSLNGKDDDSNEGSTTEKKIILAAPPLDVQVMVVLRMVLQLTVAAE